MSNDKGRELAERRRSSASGRHGKSPKDQNRYDRREIRKSFKNGEY